MSKIARFMLLTSGGGATVGWAWILGSGSSSELTRIESVSVDSSDNVYACGVTEENAIGSRDLLVVKYDSDGAEQWSKVVGNSSTFNATAGNNITVDSSGNSYIFFSSNANGGSPRIIKLTSAGARSWERYYDANYNDIRSIHHDGSNLWICGYNNNSPLESFIARLNPSNGVPSSVSETSVGGAAYNSISHSVIGDGTYAYVTGNHSSGGASNQWFVQKYNTSCERQAEGYFGGASSDAGYSIAAGTSTGAGYLYNAGSSAGGAVVKLLSNNVGDLVGVKTTDADGSFGVTYLPFVDNACAATFEVSGDGIRVSKFTRSGNVLSQSGDIIKIKQNGTGNLFASTQGRHIAADSEDNIILGLYGRLNNSNEDKGVILKLPSDLSYTGTILNQVVISSSSLSFGDDATPFQGTTAAFVDTNAAISSFSNTHTLSDSSITEETTTF